MRERKYESTLNTWLAEALREQGLDAREESGQGGGKRLDVEVRFDQIKIALEAEQGDSTAKKASAIKDADSRLRDDLADCAIAICYPDGLWSASDLTRCELLHTLRTHKDRPSAAKTEWKRDNLAQFVSVIRKVPDQLGDPDNLANALSFSLDLAVSRLSESQKQDLAASLDLPAGKLMKIEFGKAHSSRFNQAAKRAMLVIATAVMFHNSLDRHGLEKPLQDRRHQPARFYSGDWPPPRAMICAESDDPIGAFDDAWDLWLAVDYKPIFATARNALLGCAQDNDFTQAVRGTAKAALKVARNIVGLRHDLLGRIFHKVLETARYDGSFYTTTAAATLLANLAIRADLCDWADPHALARLRITDPACGTGTLLMAAAERIRDLSSGMPHERAARSLIENVLTGYDVNLTATHLAATTLGLLSPTTTFENMKIYRALLGVENGGAYLGSLEFLSQDSQPRLIPWPTGVEQMESEKELASAEPADLVIMNPPFTRDSLRHDQFSREDEKKLKAREKEVFDGLPTHLSGNSGSFLLLAEQLTANNNGSIAAVLPAVIASNASGLPIRKFLAEKFHVETIITSHDPSRIYFSENTTIGEILIICRSWPGETDKPATFVVNLYQNPTTPAESIGVAKDIIRRSRSQIKGSVQSWPRSRIAAGDWGAVQFLSPYLCQRFVELRDNLHFATTEFGQLATIGPAGRRTQDAFVRSEAPTEDAMVALWNHKTDITQKMLANSDTYIRPQRKKLALARKYWTQRSTFLLAQKMRLNTVRCTSVRLQDQVLGARWVPCRFDSDKAHSDLLEKATCVYLNSSVGILATLGDRTNKIPSYPQFSLDDWRRIPVPDFNALEEAQVAQLAQAYEDHCQSILLPLPLIMADETRQALDEAIIAALDIDREIVAKIRHELSREPSITGKPYEP